MPGPVAARVIVSGRVQGVGFRAGTRERARAEGLAGWVRNAADGSVHALLQGEAASVATVLEWIRLGGPPGGRVDSIEHQDVRVDEGISGFDVVR